MTAVEHSFRKRLFFLYLDLDELDEVFAGRWMWSHRRIALARFRREDHFGNANTSLADSVRKLVSTRGPIRLLTHPRYFGYVFNPLSLYFCFEGDDNGGPKEVVAEVQNTPWKERHCYVLQREQFAPANRSRTPKQFHVSPFLPMDLDYRWTIQDPSDSLIVSLQNWRNDTKVFDVSMSLQRREISTASLMT